MGLQSWLPACEGTAPERGSRAWGGMRTVEVCAVVRGAEKGWPLLRSVYYELHIPPAAASLHLPP